LLAANEFNSTGCITFEFSGIVALFNSRTIGIYSQIHATVFASVKETNFTSFGRAYDGAKYLRTVGDIWGISAGFPKWELLRFPLAVTNFDTLLHVIFSFFGLHHKCTASVTEAFVADLNKIGFSWLLVATPLFDIGSRSVLKADIHRDFLFLGQILYSDSSKRVFACHPVVHASYPVGQIKATETRHHARPVLDLVFGRLLLQHLEESSMGHLHGAGAQVSELGWCAVGPQRYSPAELAHPRHLACLQDRQVPLLLWVSNDHDQLVTIDSCSQQLPFACHYFEGSVSVDIFVSFNFVERPTFYREDRHFVKNGHHFD